VVFLNSIYFSEKNSYGRDRPVVFLNSIYFSEKNSYGSDRPLIFILFSFVFNIVSFCFYIDLFSNKIIFKIKIIK
jgi:hypothetical protein